MTSSSAWHVVGTPEELVEMARQYPRDIIVLQSHAAPSIGELRRYAELLGGGLEAQGFGEVRVVKYDATAALTSTAQSLGELSHHTDGSFLEHPPTRFLLSFVQADQGGGGVSTFFRIVDIVPVMPAWVFDALSRAECLFLRTYDGNTADSCVGPILSRDSTGHLTVRWRGDHLCRPRVVDPHGTRAAAAVEWFYDFLQMQEPFQYYARAGETILVPNLVTLHGRTRLSPSSHREVLRVWIT